MRRKWTKTKVIAFLCNSITSVNIPSKVKVIGTGAFEGGASIVGPKNYNKISTISFADGSELEEIGDSAFSGNPLRGTLSIPESVVKVGLEAFSTDITSGSITLRLGSNIRQIGSLAFRMYHMYIVGSNTYHLSFIYINMTEQEWKDNVKIYDKNGETGEDLRWYVGFPTISYKSE